MFIVPFTSSGHWLAVLPCLLGFACSPQAWGLFAPPSDSLWVSVVGVCLCFRLWCASGLALPLSSLGSSSRSLFVSDLVGFGGWSLPLVCLCQVVCVPCLFPGSAVFCAVPGYVALSGLGVHAYLAGLDTSSSRSPSVLVLLVLADLDGSYPWRYSHSSKILFDDLSENIIYYRGISPGRPALLPTGTSVSLQFLLD